MPIEINTQLSPFQLSTVLLTDSMLIDNPEIKKHLRSASEALANLQRRVLELEMCARGVVSAYEEVARKYPEEFPALSQTRKELKL